jgi:hypothetical protein
MRLRTQIVVVASADADEKQVDFRREDDALTTVIEDVDCETSQNLILAASEANYTLAMGKVSAGKAFYLETDKELTVFLDGEVTGHKVGPPANGTKAKLFLRGDFSVAPKITNNTASVANVAYSIAGLKA